MPQMHPGERWVRIVFRHDGLVEVMFDRFMPATYPALAAVSICHFASVAECHESAMRVRVELFFNDERCQVRIVFRRDGLVEVIV